MVQPQEKKIPIIQINIGGQIFTTTRSTLMRDQNSLIRKVIDGGKHIDFHIDEKGMIFVDRDGSTFQYILNYLRDDQCYLPIDDVEKRS